MKSIPVYRCRGWKKCKNCIDHKPHFRNEACHPEYIVNGHRCLCIKIGTMVFKPLKGKER